MPYIFRPISIWMALALEFMPIAVGSNLARASIPDSLREAESELAAGSRSTVRPLYMPINTLFTGNPTYTCASRGVTVITFTGASQERTTHPALFNAVYMSCSRFSISGSLELIAKSYRVSGNCLSLSAIRSICSGLSARRALNFSSARLASAARWLASAPSAYAVATLSLDSLWSSAAAICALRMHRYSITRPTPINRLARESIAFSLHAISLVKAYRATNSRNIPARIRRVARPDQRSLFSSSWFGSSFLLLASVRSSSI